MLFFSHSWIFFLCVHLCRCERWVQPCKSSFRALKIDSQTEEAHVAIGQSSLCYQHRGMCTRLWAVRWQCRNWPLSLALDYSAIHNESCCHDTNGSSTHSCWTVAHSFNKEEYSDCLRLPRSHVLLCRTRDFTRQHKHFSHAVITSCSLKHGH